MTVFAEGATGNLRVDVTKADSTSVGAGATVKRYSTSWAYIDSRTTDISGAAFFSNVNEGTYNFEAWYNSEFWGGKSGTVVAGASRALPIQRFMPYAYEMKVYNGSTDVTGGSVPLGTALRFEVKVRNGGTVPYNSRVHLRVDASQTSPYDNNDPTSSSQTIAANGGTATFTFNFTPTVATTYYRWLEVETDTNAGNYSKTDSWAWSQIIVVAPGVVNITVTIKDAWGNALNGAAVKLWEDWGLWNGGEKTTGTDGNATWTDVPANKNLKAEAIKTGFDTKTDGPFGSGAAGGSVSRTVNLATTVVHRIIGLRGNLAFGNVVTSRTATATLTIGNSGNSALTVTGIGYPLGFSGAWSGSIAAGNSTNVTVAFRPVALTTYGGTVTVTNNSTGGTGTIIASGIGTIWRPEAQGDGSFGLRTNRFGFNINWHSGRVVVVDGCTNLANPAWIPLQINTLAGGSSNYFSDSKWTNYIGRFYRIRSSP